MILLVFPHQLYEKHSGLRDKPTQIVLIEDTLFFGDSLHPAAFHKQKLWLHRSTMQRYASKLRREGHTVTYVDYESASRGLPDVLNSLPGANQGVKVADPVDFLLEKRLRRATNLVSAELTVLPTRGFINQRQENEAYRAGKKRWFMADFYKWQRQRLRVLMDGDQPAGGRWSFDEDNRRKVPSKLLGAITELPRV